QFPRDACARFGWCGSLDPLHWLELQRRRLDQRARNRGPGLRFRRRGSCDPCGTAPTSAGPLLKPYKLAVIAALTGEMMRHSSAEDLVRQVLIESTGPGIDKVLFSANAAIAGERPAGLLNGIAGLTPAAAGAKATAIVDDLQTLGAAVAPVAGNGNIILVASADAAVALVLRLPSSVEWPVLMSSSLAARTVIAIAANAVVSAVEGAPVIEARTEPAIHMADPAAPIVDIGGISAQPVMSLFQTDSVALKLTWPISWALR